MSDYTRIFAISASGMAVERLRLEVAAMNLSNAHSTQGLTGKPFIPLRVVAKPATSASFEAMLSDRADPLTLRGVNSVEIQSVQAAPQLEYDPGNPLADDRGFVQRSPVNPLEEMVTVMTSTRAYEANVRTLNAAKSMAMKALEIGDTRT